MVARADDLRFYVDETSIGLGMALERARTDVVYVGHPLVPELPRRLLDTEWIPHVAARGLIVLGRDRHIRTRPGERELFASHGLKVMRLSGKKDLSNWDALVRLVRRWDDIESIIRDRLQGPWCYEIGQASLRELPPPSA